MRWSFLWQRPHQVTSQLVDRKNNVVYFQDPIFLDPFLFVKAYREKNVFLKRKIKKNLLLANVFFFPFFGKLRFVTEKFALMFLRLQLRCFKFKPDVAIFYSYHYAFLLKTLKSMGAKIVYDCIDDFSSFSDAHDGSNVLNSEKELTAQASLIIGASKILCKKLSKINSKCFYVPNAVDFGHLNSALRAVEVPREIKNLRAPIIGFIGAIYDWFDDGLVCKLAELHPDYSILLVGPLKYGLDNFEKYPNIKMVGAKPYKVLPQYLARMDVCLIPFKINKLTLASNPIKLYEYLAAGKPVVSTALPEICENASEVVMIAKDSDDFVRKVEGAVNQIEKEDEKVILKRITFAENNSWEKRVETIEKLLKSVM